ncbi:hypothetical protein GIB67_017469 [Kingdonia uniflora]|uniref:Uncharacterized protein n=1 Tax=Kingdonia uniflora TaxID=39325 RepID=A0A7J7M4F3_9MAGN|nr:hypothetical protein GIB67_017469 [Kingdonia uniflora]
MSHAKQILQRSLFASTTATNVPKGHFAVYVGLSQKKRFVVPLSYLNQPSFQDLLSRTEEEFGFVHPMGGLTELSFKNFGGRNPFDDYFFNPPSMFGPSLFGGAPNQAPVSGFIPRLSGPVIQEILSDESDGEGGKEEKKDNPRKHLRSGREVHVDDQTKERRMKHVQLRNAYNRLDRPTPQTQSFSFQSSTVTYGGPNGA